MTYPTGAMHVLDVATGPMPSERGNPCAAIPAASAHGWRTDVHCASLSNTDVVYQGVVYPVCKIHRASWERALAKGAHGELAAKWGWT